MNQTILLAEANEKTGLTLQAHLSETYGVTVTRDIAQTRRQLDVTPPDLYLIDLNIGDGVADEFLDLYALIATDPARQIIPRVFLSSARTAQLRERLLLVGEETVIEKPVHMGQLKLTIEKHLAASFVRHEFSAFSLPAMIGQRIGNVVIREIIAKGGMGAVFLGYQESLDRSVAVKVILPELIETAETVVRFRQEALAIAKLKNPHIVQVFDAGTLNQQVFYIVMEFLAGETVTSLLEREGRLSPRKSVEVIRQVGEGLRAAHSAQICHRDIKPANLIIDESGLVTITDFGLARLKTDLHRTRAGMILGTPSYLSPEQVTGTQPCDARSDIYSLGIMFYELLTGTLPFSANNPVAILYKHVKEPVPSPLLKVPDLPPALELIISRMTAKDPQDRYQDCSELLSDLNDGILTKQLLAFETAHPSKGEIPPTVSLEQSHDALLEQHLISLSRLDEEKYASQNRVCMSMLHESGFLQGISGEMDAAWGNIGLTGVGLLRQLQDVVRMGAWVRTLIQTDTHELVLFPLDTKTGSALYTRPTVRQDTLASLPAGVQAGSSPSSTGVRLVEQIAAVAGVRGVIIQDGNGSIIEHRPASEFTSAGLAARLQLFPSIMSALPFPLTVLDFQFEEGRCLISAVPDRMVSVIADSGCNLTLLTILLERLRWLPPAEARTTTPLPHGASELDSAPTMPAAIFASVELALARHIGPISGTLIQKEIKRMGFSRERFPHDQFGLLVDRLAKRLEPPYQAAFTDSVLDIVQQNRSEKRS